MLLLMDTCEMQTPQALARRLEVLRDRLHEALDACGGNQLDPEVQRVSNEFDSVLNMLMRQQSQSQGSPSMIGAGWRGRK